MAPDRPAARSTATPEPPAPPQWLTDSINAWPSPTRETILGFTASAWAEGFAAGVVAERRRRRGSKPAGDGDGGTDG